MIRKSATDRILELSRAISEAKRFIRAAEEARTAITAEQESLYYSKSFAAAKRASMDLTRALAKMRGTAA